MKFVTLCKVRTDDFKLIRKAISDFRSSKEIKVIDMFLLFGKYDFIFIYEADNEVIASKHILRLQSALETETFLASSIEEI